MASSKSFILRYAVRSLTIILMVALLLRTFLISSYSMSGSSMLPSVWPGDFMIAAKWSKNKVRRGDVVVAHCPGNPERTCLKRVVGEPGDRVEFHEGKLLLNGQQAVYRSLSEDFQIESFGGDEWGVWPEPQPDEMQAVVVPPDHLFVLNDRRSDRDDSRTWGTISRSNVDAKAIRVWASLDWYKDGEVREWPRVRWERMLRSID